VIEGYPFAPGFLGDDFPNAEIPFHRVENQFPDDRLPEATETVDVAVVGGGLGGMAAAYLLRHRRPVVIELHERFGGVAQAEEWEGIPYSMGGAYFITPDKGSFLERFYHELGADRVYRLDEGENPVELNGKIVRGFWDPQSRPKEERAAFARYAEIVAYFVEKYPEIPLPEGKDNQWILDLDTRSFREDVEQRMEGIAIPESLAAGIQAYFYSSFNAGWEEISAASGWNFVAAEEFGRWVCPGGNSYLIKAMWEELAKLDKGRAPECSGRHLRAGCRVVDVRLAGESKVQVTYKDRDGGFRSLFARRVVMACPKHLMQYIMPTFRKHEEDRLAAIHQVNTRAYVVANVLLNERVDPSVYDLFLLRGGVYPCNDAEAEAWGLAADALNGGYAAGKPKPDAPRRGVLTVYWALPQNHGRFQLIDTGSYERFAERLAPQLDEMLPVFGLGRKDVEQVRMARWGHAMPLAAPGLIAGGVTDRIRAPIGERIYFVNQDNWALPAVENTLLDAEHFAGIIDRSL